MKSDVTTAKALSLWYCDALGNDLSRRSRSGLQQGTFCRQFLPVKRFRRNAALISRSLSNFASENSIKDWAEFNQTGSRKIALVLGSSGALGSSISQHLSQELKMKVIGADVIELPSELTEDWELDEFIELKRDGDLSSLTTDLVRGVHSFLEDNINHDDEGQHYEGNGIDAIICANGGWTGDPAPLIGSDFSRPSMQSLIEGAHEHAEVATQMLHKNLHPVIAAGFIAQYYMNPSGLMVVMGATVALSATPGMLGYGISKAGTHHLVHTLGASTGKSIASKATRKVARKLRQNLLCLDDLTVVGMLPTTLDTLANRSSRPSLSNSYDEWTKPIDVAKEIGLWIRTPQLRPHSGSLVKITSTVEGSTFELVR